MPIPEFDPQQPEHVRLAELCGEAEEVATVEAERVRANKPHAGQVAVSSAIRERLADHPVGREIDEIARRMLPEQAR